MANVDREVEGAFNHEAHNIVTFGHLVETQCRQAIDTVREAEGTRPITLRDFKTSLDKSLNALSVSSNK